MAGYMGTLDGNSMTTPEVISSNSRSESAKKRWERERARKEEKEDTMSSNPPIKAWIYHSEWFALMATLIGCFLFVHHENVNLTNRLDSHIQTSNKRLDDHMEAINRRADESSTQLNRRCDELHKEFYDLLKEMRREEK